MNVQPNPRDASYLDLIFFGRNKAYGGYELRKHYPRRIAKAAGWMLGGALCLSAMVAFRPTDKLIAEANRPVIMPTDLPPVPPAEKPKPEQTRRPEARQPAQPPAVTSTIVFVAPIVVPEDEVITPPPTIDSLEGRTAGLESTPGNGGYRPGEGGPIGEGEGNGDDSTGSDDGGMVSNKPFISVEQMPEFNGDITAYLNRNVRYPESAREASVEGKSVIRFVVNEDGSISDVEVVRSAEHSLDMEAARVIRAMPAWKPGFQNGKAVKVYFTIPVRFQLD